MTDPTVLQNPREFTRALKKARKELIKLPNVLGVGYGFKEIKGKSTSDLAIVVFVKIKKKPRAVAPEERIQAEYHGIKTDVVELGKRKREIDDDTDMMFVDFAKIHRENRANIKKAQKRNPQRHTNF